MLPAILGAGKALLKKKGAELVGAAVGKGIRKLFGRKKKKAPTPLETGLAELQTGLTPQQQAAMLAKTREEGLRALKGQRARLTEALARAGVLASPAGAYRMAEAEEALIPEMMAAARDIGLKSEEMKRTGIEAGLPYAHKLHEEARAREAEKKKKREELYEEAWGLLQEKLKKKPKAVA